jgi:glycosyltransferase involved in cell wall biosynthesis
LPAEPSDRSRDARASNGPVDVVRVVLVGPDVAGGAPGGMATISRALLAGFDSEPGVEIEPIANFDEGGNLRRLSMGLRAVVEVIRRRRSIDVVHVQVAHQWSIERDLVLVATARAMGIPVVAQYHGAGQAEDYDNGSGFHRMCYRALIRLCRNVVLGPKSLAWLRAVDPTASAAVIPNGIETAPDPAPFPTGAPSLVFVGRLGERKGVYDLLSALEQLDGEGIRPETRLLGDGEIEAVRARVTGSGLSGHVSVEGWQDAEVVTAALRTSWALVLPSSAEGLPLAILEAMTLGRAVVSSPVGEIDSLVSDGLSGLLIEPGDVEGLAGALRQVTSDREGTEKMGVRGHEHVLADFSTASVLRQLEDVYRRATVGSRRS